MITTPLQKWLYARNEAPALTKNQERIESFANQLALELKGRANGKFISPFSQELAKKAGETGNRMLADAVSFKSPKPWVDLAVELNGIFMKENIWFMFLMSPGQEIVAYGPINEKIESRGWELFFLEWAKTSRFVGDAMSIFMRDGDNPKTWLSQLVFYPESSERGSLGPSTDDFYSLAIRHELGCYDALFRNLEKGEAGRLKAAFISVLQGGKMGGENIDILKKIPNSGYLVTMLIYANRAAEKYKGLGKEEFIGAVNTDKKHFLVLRQVHNASEKKYFCENAGSLPQDAVEYYTIDEPGSLASIQKVANGIVTEMAFGPNPFHALYRIYRDIAHMECMGSLVAKEYMPVIYAELMLAREFMNSPDFSGTLGGDEKAVRKMAGEYLNMVYSGIFEKDFNYSKSYDTLELYMDFFDKLNGR